jgi:sugar phosphate isomerase/epimerase
MRIDRRSLLTGGAVVGIGLALQADRASASPQISKAKAALHLSSQEWIIPGQTLKEKVARMEKWGFDGIELGGGGLPGRVKEVQEALAGSKVRVSAICAGYAGALISDQESERRKAVDTMKEILAAAGELKSTGLIIVPAFNNQTTLDNKTARKILMDLLPEVGDAAAKAGTRVLLEPLNRGEAFFLRQLADAAAMVREANHPGVAMMGDFYHMGIEETSDMGAFISAGSSLYHVHLASRKRNLPGQDERDFMDGFKGLKMIGFQHYCSLECGVVGDREREIPKSAEFLRKQWAKA